MHKPYLITEDGKVNVSAAMRVLLQHGQELQRLGDILKAKADNLRKQGAALDKLTGKD